MSPLPRCAAVASYNILQMSTLLWATETDSEVDFAAFEARFGLACSWTSLHEGRGGPLLRWAF